MFLSFFNFKLFFKYFLNHFNILISKIIFLNKKYIILIYFQVKNILKPFYPIKKAVVILLDIQYLQCFSNDHEYCKFIGSMSECVFRIATTEALFYEILKKYFLKLVFYVFLNCFNVLMIKINFKKLIKYYFIIFKNKITL